MSRIIISDIHSNNNGGICTGHYIALAKMYLTLFSGKSEVKVASGPIYSQYFPKEDMIKLPYDMVAGKNYLVNRFKALMNARSLFRQTRGDVTVLQDGKPLTNHIGSLLFCRREQSLFLIKYTTAGLSSPFGKLVWKLLRRKVDGVICPNDEVGRAFGVPYCVVPDYIYSGEGGRCRVDYGEKKFDFCIVGRLNKDKGVDKSIKALSGMSFRTVVAGKPESEAYGETLRSCAEGSTCIDLRLGYLSDEDYLDYISNSRYCLLNYQGEYSNRSSGVVLDIVFSGVPVVGNRCKALQFIEDYGLGYIYDSLDEVPSAGLFNEETYGRFLDGIDRYRQENRNSFEKLRSFIVKQHE